MKKNLILTSLVALVATAGVAKADDISMADLLALTDVTFAGDYADGASNVSTGAPSAYSFSYTGTQADGSATSSIPSNTTTGVLKSNFAYTLADGVTTETLADDKTYVSTDYVGQTVAGTNDGTNDYTMVHAAEGYALNAGTAVAASSYSYDNPQGGTKTLVLDASGNPVVDTLTSTFAYSEASAAFTGDVTTTTVSAGATLDGTAYVLMTDTNNNVFTLSADGTEVLMNGSVLTTTPAGELLDKFTAANAAYMADATLFNASVSALEADQATLASNANVAKNVFDADVIAQGNLVDMFKTYTDATTAYTNATKEGSAYDVALKGYNTAKSAYDNADTLYNTPISEVVDYTLTSANDYTDDKLAGVVSVEDGIATVGYGENSAQMYTKDAAEAIFAEKEAWIAKELGYDTTTTDAKTALNAAGFEADDFLGAVVENKESIADHETRLVSAEETIDGHTTAIADHETRISANTTAIADHETRLGSAEGTIADHGTTLVDHETRISANATAIASEFDRASAEELSIRSDFATADALTLNSANEYTNAALTEAKAYADASSALTLKNANAYTDAKVNELNKELSGGIASAVALSSVAVSNVAKGEVSVGAGYGYYNSQSAAAFGAAMGLTDRWSVNAGAGIAESNVSFRAGTNYKFKLF